jgi:hypothetical protein
MSVVGRIQCGGKNYLAIEREVVRKREEVDVKRKG